MFIKNILNYFILSISFYFIEIISFEDEVQIPIAAEVETLCGNFSDQFENAIKQKDFARMQELIEKNPNVINQEFYLRFKVNQNDYDLVKFLIENNAPLTLHTPTGINNALEPIRSYKIALLLLLNYDITNFNLPLILQEIINNNELRRRSNLSTMSEPEIRAISFLFMNWQQFGQQYKKYIENLYFEKLEEIEREKFTGLPTVLNKLIGQYALPRVLEAPANAHSFEEFVKIQQERNLPAAAAQQKPVSGGAAADN